MVLSLYFHRKVTLWAASYSACVVYSCFEKGCPTKPYATMPKGIMGNGGLWCLIGLLVF